MLYRYLVSALGPRNRIVVPTPVCIVTAFSHLFLATGRWTAECRPVSPMRLLLIYKRKSDAVRDVLSWELVGDN